MVYGISRLQKKFKKISFNWFRPFRDKKQFFKWCLSFLDFKEKKRISTSRNTLTFYVNVVPYVAKKKNVQNC